MNLPNNFTFYFLIFFCMIISQSCQDKTKKLYYHSGEVEAVIKQITNKISSAEFFYKDGALKAEGFMNNKGFWIGHWKEYYGDGVLKWEGEYNNGSRVLLINDKWPDIKELRGSIEIQGNPDTLLVGKKYFLRIIASDLAPDLYSFTYKDYTDIEVNNDAENSDTFPYIICAQEQGELILLITLPDSTGNYVKYKSTAVFQLFAN